MLNNRFTDNPRRHPTYSMWGRICLEDSPPPEKALSTQDPTQPLRMWGREEPVRESFCPAPTPLSRIVQVQSDLRAIRRELNIATLQADLDRVRHFVFGPDRANLEAMLKMLGDYPQHFDDAGLRDLRRVTAAKLASLPALRRSFEYTAETRASGDRRITFVVSQTNVVDRHQSRVETAGIDLTNYRKNPVFLWGHDGYGGFNTPAMEHVIGKAVGFRQTSEILELEIEFFTPDVNPKSEQALRMVRAGGLQATSIGFIPREVKTEIRDGREIPVITRSELLEVSLVTIPSNPGVEVTGGRAWTSV